MSQDWQAPFRILREQFLTAARENFRVNLALASFADHSTYRAWYDRTIQADLLREATNPTSCESDRAPQMRAIEMVGESQGVQRFEALAKEAGNSLPSDFYPANRLFPWFNELSNLSPGPVTLWSEFLFVARAASFRVGNDWATGAGPIARLDGDPFLTSATAIEQFLLTSGPPDLGAYFLQMRTVCPWLVNNAGGFPVTSFGDLASPVLRFDLAQVFRSTVELGIALGACDAVRNEAPSDEARSDWFKASLDASRVADTAADRLLCVLNSRMSSVRDWSQQLDFADASPDARDALRTLGLALADIRGDWEERGRELLAGGAEHLWAGMRTEDRAAVREHLVETRRLWNWPAQENGESIAYTGPRATLSDSRVIDHRWRTRRADYPNQLQTITQGENTLVDTIRLPDGDYFDIYRDDVKGTRCSIPSLCPHADPTPPVDLRPEGDLLAEMECRFHDLGLIGPEESIHWVGRQERHETRCRCELAPAQFYQPRPAEWQTLREFKSGIVGMMKLVRPYVEGRSAGLVFTDEKVELFDTMAERVYGLAQSLSIPLPPITNPNILGSYPRGPVALPVHELPEGTIISELDGRLWLSNWRAVRVGIDARLALIDRAGRHGNGAEGVDARDYPLDAPAGTPTPLREAYESVARALFEATEFRREPWNGAIGFREFGRGLAAHARAATQRYTDAELQLQAVADAQNCAHHEALAAVRGVSDAIGHVVLGVIPDHLAVAHIRQVPAPDVAGLLRRMRQQVSRAALGLTAPTIGPPGKPAIAYAPKVARVATNGEPSGGVQLQERIGRPRDGRKQEVVKFVHELREQNMPWKHIPNAVFERFKIRYTAETLRGYLKSGQKWGESFHPVSPHFCPH